MSIKEKFGKRLRELRIKRKISQEKLSEMANISQNMLSGIETGNNFCSSETLEHLIKALNVEPSEMFEFNHQEQTQILILEINKLLAKNPEKVAEIYKIIRAILN